MENSTEDPVKLHGVKRRSTFYDLPYWEVSGSYLLSMSFDLFLSFRI